MIIIFGSIAMDLAVTVRHFPEPGETVLSPHYEMLPGGRGANQALAAARAGAKVALVGKTGDDGMGMRLANGLKRDGVMTSGIGLSDLPTGMDVIMTNEDGRNGIVLAAGANIEATADQVPDEILTPANMVLLQTDMPAAESWALLERAKTRGAATMVNLAPMIAIPEQVWPLIDYLVLSLLEARQAAAMPDQPAEDEARAIATALARKGNLTCVMTMGEHGSLAVTPGGDLIRVPALPLGPGAFADRTGAADAYCGTLAAALHGGMALKAAMRMASVAGSLTCMNKGAQNAMPYLGDIEERLGDLPDGDDDPQEG